MGVLKGKLAYMSPEAVRGEPVDRRSDIFSVGVMLWEAATGLRLWQDHDEVAVYRRLATGDLPLNPTATATANPLLMRIAHRALAVDPYQRYETAEDMRLDIEDLLMQLGRITRAPALSAYMESFFAVEREKFQAIVEDALNRFPTKPISRRRLLANELSASYPALDPSEPPTTVSMPNGGTFRTTAYDVPLESGELPDFRPPRRGLALAAIAAAFAVGVAGIAHAPANFQTSWLGTMLHRSSNGQTATSHAAAPNAVVAPPNVVAAATGVASPSSAGSGTSADPGVAAPGSPPGKPSAPLEPAPRSMSPNGATGPGATPPKGTIAIVLAARPAEAHFYLDGEPVAGNPATLHRRADDKRHRVRVEAPGYTTVWKPIDFDRDVARDFELVPYAPSGVARSARPGEAHVESGEEAPKAKRGKRSLDRDDPWAP
jgi:serine/threonine-protein kinase